MTVAELSGVRYTPLKRGAERREWLQSGEKRITVHFVPYHGSWLNMIEIWFGILTSKCLKDGWYESVDTLRESIMGFVGTWNEHFAHPFSWTYRGDGLHGKAVRRFIRLLVMESAQVNVVFLTKQLLLMRNLVRGYWSHVGENDWQELLQVLLRNQTYVADVISSGTKEHQRENAERTLEELSSMLYDSLVKSGRITKSA